jgi:hypothetical protein
VVSTNKCLAQRNKPGTGRTATKKQTTSVGALAVPIGRKSMDDMSWIQRGVALLSILAITLMGLSINKARAGEQTRFYGPDGRSIGTAATSGNTTTFYGADGRRTGSATTSGNIKTFYGADGRRTGSSTVSGKR